MTSINLNTFALHFGVYPDSTGALSVNGHRDANVEHEIDLTFGGTAGPPPTGLSAYVSGSWACWGPADQASDGDRSLHVVVNMPDAGVQGAESVLIVWDMLRMNLEGRLLDHAVMTDPFTGEERGVVLFRGNPFVNILPTDKAVGAVMRSDVLAVLDEDPDDLDAALNGGSVQLAHLAVDDYALSDCVNWSTNVMGDCGGRVWKAGGKVKCETCHNRRENV